MKRLVPISFFALFVAMFMLGSLPTSDVHAQNAKKNKKKDVTKDDTKKDDAKKDDTKKDDAKKALKEEPKKEPFVADVPLVELKGHDNWIRSLAYSKDGSLLVSAGRDRTVRVWDLSAKKEKEIVKGFNDETVLAVSGDKIFVSFGKWNKEKKGYEAEVKILSLPGGKEAGTVKAHAETIESVGVTPDGKSIVTGSDDQTAKVFDATGKEVATLKGHSGKVYGVALSPDGKRAATASEDGSLKIWDVASSKDTATIKSGLPEPKAEPKVEPKAEPKVDPKAKEAKKGKGAAAPPAAAKQGPPFRCVAFSPDGKTLAAGAEDGEVRLIDADSGNVSKTIKAHEGIFAVAWSTKGDKLATSGWDQTIRIWDTTGKELNVIKAHNGTVTALAFSPNGETIASGGLDGLVKVWPVAKK